MPNLWTRFLDTLQEMQKEGNKTMKTNFLSFVKKEALHILRDKRTMMIVLLIPIVLMILFGFAISTELNNLNVAVSVQKHTEDIRGKIEKLSANPYFTFVGYVNQKDAETMLRSSKADAVVVFDNEGKMQFLFDASNTNTAMSGSIYLQSVMSEENLSNQELFNLHLLYNPQMKSAYNFVPGIMGLIFILICAMMTSVAIVREKESGTMEVLLVSPVRPIKIILAKMIPYFVISCINLTTILLVSRFLLDVPLSGSLFSIIFISLIYLVLSLSLGLLVSTISSSQVMALLISAMVMMMPILMLSGMIFPIENLPSVLQPVPYIVPAKWYIEAIRKLMIMGLPITAVTKEILILILMSVVLVFVSLKKFNDKLD